MLKKYKFFINKCLFWETCVNFTRMISCIVILEGLTSCKNLEKYQIYAHLFIYQVYRVCNDGRDGPQGAGFVCPNGTLFDQYQFTCEFWNKVGHSIFNYKTKVY